MQTALVRRGITVAAGIRPPLALGLLALLLMLGGTVRASAADVNTIKSIATIKTGAGPTVEVTLTSTRPFDVRDAAVLLQIGASTFYLSHGPVGGSLKTIVFVLTPADFAATHNGDPVTAYFDCDTPTGPDAWAFGKLNKSLLK